jgi:hypothetical protein
MGEVAVLLSKIFGAAVGYALGMGIIYIFLISLAGYMAGGWYFKKKSCQIDLLMKVFGWLNLVAWFLPITGYFIGFASWRFFENNKNKTLKIITIIGITLSLINGAAGIILRQLGYLT